MLPKILVLFHSRSIAGLHVELVIFSCFPSPVCRAWPSLQWYSSPCLMFVPISVCVSVYADCRAHVLSQWISEYYKKASWLREWERKANTNTDETLDPAGQRRPQVMTMDLRWIYHQGQDVADVEFEFSNNSAHDRLCPFNLCPYRCLAHVLIISLSLLM